MVAVAGIIAAALLATGAGFLIGPGILHPERRELSPQLIEQADQAFRRIEALREDFEVRADDDVVLRGWLVRPRTANGDWVLLFHGVSDNRVGMVGYAEFLLESGYSVVMMDARAHGASDGSMASYGWHERHDTRGIVNALFEAERVHCLFVLGESMGGAVALQAAAVESRIAGVVAESAFSNLEEVAYDYAGLRLSHWLGKTLFRPGVVVALRKMQEQGGFAPEDVAPEKSVAERAFPVLLICGTHDGTIPARHTKRIFQQARGPKQLWLVPGAPHSATLGTAPEEFKRRVVEFYRAIHLAVTRD